MAVAADKDNAGREISIFTTMHYVLQMQRAATIAEATGRASMYLTAVSMALVALGFIAQATELSDAFFVFVYVLATALLMIGATTFMRELQLGAEDGIMARAAERLRHAYVDHAPGVERWFAIPLAESDNARAAVGTGRVRWQSLLTAASMIAIVNAAILGVVVAIAIMRSSDDLSGSSTIGAVVAAAALALQIMISDRFWRASEHAVTTDNA